MEPILCANGCGFYGTVENRNMCSKCYKDFLKREIIIPSLKSIAKVDQPDQNDGAVSEVTAEVGGSTIAKHRCKSCNKKVGLTGFHCRCGNLFCRRHRLPELHACNVDYKTVPGRNDHELAEVIKVDKLMWRA